MIKHNAFVDVLAGAQSTAEALTALTALADTAHKAACIGVELQEAANAMSLAIEPLARHIGCTVEDVYAPLFRERESGRGLP